MSRCSSGKIMHVSRSVAEEELIRVHIRYGDGPNQPNGVYQCDICGAYHLTSKSTDTTFLNSPEVRRRIRLGRDAGSWLDI